MKTTLDDRETSYVVGFDALISVAMKRRFCLLQYHVVVDSPTFRSNISHPACSANRLLISDFLLACSSTLKMEAVFSSETSCYRIVRLYIPENHVLYCHTVLMRFFANRYSVVCCHGTAYWSLYALEECQRKKYSDQPVGSLCLESGCGG
jgi:hypothetical protein